MAAATKTRRRKPWKGATNATRKLYQSLGYHVWYAEKTFKRRIPGTRIVVTRTADAWGFADFICFKAERPGFVAANACVHKEIKAHVEKFRLLTAAFDFLRANPDNRIAIVGWRRPEARGEEPTKHVRQMRLSDFENYPEGASCEIRIKKPRRSAARAANGSGPSSVGARAVSSPGPSTGAAPFRSTRRSRISAASATTKPDTASSTGVLF